MDDERPTPPVTQERSEVGSEQKFRRRSSSVELEKTLAALAELKSANDEKATTLAEVVSPGACRGRRSTSSRARAALMERNAVLLAQIKEIEASVLAAHSPLRATNAQLRAALTRDKPPAPPAPPTAPPRIRSGTRRGSGKKSSSKAKGGAGGNPPPPVPPRQGSVVSIPRVSFISSPADHGINEGWFDAFDMSSMATISWSLSTKSDASAASLSSGATLPEEADQRDGDAPPPSISSTPAVLMNKALATLAAADLLKLAQETMVKQGVGPEPPRPSPPPSAKSPSLSTMLSIAEGASKASVVVVVGAPGVGKTTWISQWKKEGSVRASWSGRDGDGNAWATFFLASAATELANLGVHPDPTLGLVLTDLRDGSLSPAQGWLAGLRTLPAKLPDGVSERMTFAIDDITPAVAEAVGQSASVLTAAIPWLRIIITTTCRKDVLESALATPAVKVLDNPVRESFYDLEHHEAWNSVMESIWSQDGMSRASCVAILSLFLSCGEVGAPLHLIQAVLAEFNADLAVNVDRQVEALAPVLFERTVDFTPRPSVKLYSLCSPSLGAWLHEAYGGVIKTLDLMVNFGERVLADFGALDLSNPPPLSGWMVWALPTITAFIGALAARKRRGTSTRAVTRARSFQKEVHLRVVMNWRWQSTLALAGDTYREGLRPLTKLEKLGWPEGAWEVGVVLRAWTSRGSVTSSRDLDDIAGTLAMRVRAAHIKISGESEEAVDNSPGFLALEKSLHETHALVWANSSHPPILSPTLDSIPLNGRAVAMTRRLVDGKIALGQGPIVELVDVASHETVRSFKGHTSEVNSLEVFCHDRILASGADDDVVKLWDFASGRQLTEFVDSQDRVWSLVGLDSCTLVAGSADNRIRVYRASFPGSRANLESNLASHDASVVSDALDSMTWSLDATLSLHTDSVMCLAAVPGGQANQFVSGGNDGQLVLWTLGGSSAPMPAQPGRRIQESTANGEWKSVTVLPDGTLAAGGADNRVYVFDGWNTPGPVTHTALVGHTSTIRVVRALGEGRMASGCEGANIWVWGQDSNGVWSGQGQLKGHSSEVWGLAPGDQEGRLISGGTDGWMYVWDASDPPAVLESPADPGANISAMEVLDDGSLATTTTTGQVTIWRTGGLTSSILGRCLQPDGLTETLYAVRSIGPFVFAGGRTNEVYGWKRPAPSVGAAPEEWPLVARLAGHTDCLETVTVMPDKKRLLSGGEDGFVRLWDVSSVLEGDNLETKMIESSRRFGIGGTGIVHSIKAIDNNLVAVAQSNVVTLWDIDGEDSKPLQSARVADASFVWSISVLGAPSLHSHPWSDSSDHFVVGGCSDGAVRVMELSESVVQPGDSSGKIVREFKGHLSNVDRVLFVTDDIVISGGIDSTVRVWRLSTGAEIAREDLDGDVTAMAYDPVREILYLAQGYAWLGFKWTGNGLSKESLPQSERARRKTRRATCGLM